MATAVELISIAVTSLSCRRAATTAVTPTPGPISNSLSPRRNGKPAVLISVLLKYLGEKTSGSQKKLRPHTVVSYSFGSKRLSSIWLEALAVFSWFDFIRECYFHFPRLSLKTSQR